MTAAQLPVWLDGALVPAEDARIALSDRGFLLGDGVFETMLWRGPARIARFQAHMARLSHAARELGIAADIDEAEVRAALDLVCAASSTPLAVRLSLSRGSGPRGLAVPDPASPLMALTASPWSRPGPVSNLVRTTIARAAGAPSARFKTLSYIDNVEALRLARTAGGDDGIMVGAAAQPLCATAANLIVAVGDRLLTPPVSDGALPGITRGALVASGLVKEAALGWDDLANARGIALTNALVGIRAVLAFEGRALPDPSGWTAPLQAELGQAG